MRSRADTAEAILASAADAVRRTVFDDIAYGQLGESVGVSERTVYRHFPTRGHLLSELAQWIETQYFAAPAFLAWEDFELSVAERFTSFDARPACAFILARAECLSPVNEDHPSFFDRSVGVLIETLYPSLNVRDSRRIVAMLCHFSSAQYWARCRTGLGMGAEAITASFRTASAEMLGVLPAAPGTPRSASRSSADPAPGAEQRAEQT